MILAMTLLLFLIYIIFVSRKSLAKVYGHYNFPFNIIAIVLYCVFVTACIMGTLGLAGLLLNGIYSHLGDIAIPVFMVGMEVHDKIKGNK